MENWIVDRPTPLSVAERVIGVAESTTNAPFATLSVPVRFAKGGQQTDQNPSTFGGSPSG